MVESKKFGSLTINVYKTRREMGFAAANDGAQKAAQILKEREYVNIIFAAAPSQFELYEGLLSSSLDFSRVNAFHMDEYIGLDKDAPQLFGNLLTSHLFSKKQFRSVNLIDSGNDPEKECKRYAELLEKYPPDIIFHGIGENAHLAFNDPPVADFDDKKMVKIVHMDSICRNQQVHDGCFEHIDLVPKHAITLTIPQLTHKAKHLIVTVPTALKADAVKNTVSAEISENVPATILRKHSSAVMFLDVDAAKFSNITWH